jgi:hypothetical protein
MPHLIQQPIAANAAKNWIFWRNNQWPNGSHRGTGLSLRLAKSPFPCCWHHFFLGAASTRASKSDSRKWSTALHNHGRTFGYREAVVSGF